MMTEHHEDAEWNVAEWHGKMLVDRDGERIGKLQDVYVDVENDEPQPQVDAAFGLRMTNCEPSNPSE